MDDIQTLRFALSGCLQLFGVSNWFCLRPTLFLAVPRLLCHIHSQVLVICFLKTKVQLFQLIGLV